MDFEQLLKESVASHGHLCAGQVIGVRMAMLGLRLIGVPRPKAPEWRKKVIVYIEIDRCATDAICSVTGCQLGRRSMKFKDYGINAATFVNLADGTAYRIVSSERSRDLAAIFPGAFDSPRERQLAAYRAMPEHELFTVQQVDVRIGESDLPGPSRRAAYCQRCGQKVRDGKETVEDGAIVCRPCSAESYFTVVADLSLQTGDRQPGAERSR